MAATAQLPRLRTMLPADVDAATELILGNEWGVRREWLEFATTQSVCVPLVAEADGQIVATGVGTANGPVGWIGTIFIAPDRRGRGLGRAITQAIIDRLDSAGCRSLALVATAEGRLLYERMGFEVQSRYHVLQAIGLPESGAEDGGVEGYVLRAPWGGGATVARTPEAALRILTARRRSAGVGGRVRLGLLDENSEGLARLLDVGLRLTWSAPRMLRGEPLVWRPSWIWGQFNHAMG